MSTLAIILIVAGVVILVVLVGGIVAVRHRARAQEATFAERVAAADRALETARVQDKGWDRELLEEAARRAVSQARPDWSYDVLHLVLVDDRPGVADDRAHFLAVGGGDELRVILTRRNDGWAAERID
jgi:hypothetical protein